MATILDGKALAEQCKQEVKKQRKPWPEDLAWR